VLQVYDPTTNKLQVSHAVIFEENRPWRWEEDMAATPHATFTGTYTLEEGTLETDTGA
jgi:hypothetical protein